MQHGPDLVAVICQQQRQGDVVGSARQPLQHVQAVVVAPVEILEDQQLGPRPRPSHDRVQQRGDDLLPARLGIELGWLREVGRRRHDPGQELDQLPLQRFEVGHRRRRRAAHERRAQEVEQQRVRGAGVSVEAPALTTRSPLAPAYARASGTRRDLPMPASPDTTASTRRPAAAASITSRSAVTSASRPISSVLLRATPAMAPWWRISAPPVGVPCSLPAPRSLDDRWNRAVQSRTRNNPRVSLGA